MKETFIEELVERVLLAHDGQLQEVTLIFPNRRAGLFFRKALGRRIERPIWMPEVISMEDFVGRFTTLRKLETLEAVFAMFEAYRAVQPQQETFDQFYFWGEMILRDFEEIDQYLIDTRNLFTSIKTQKELDEEFYFLDEEDKKVIQTFWQRFLPKASKTQEAFLETWKLLLPLYDHFTKSLLDRGEAYGGLIYRKVAESLPQINPAREKQLYFAGFNALTAAEEQIIRYFVREHAAHAVWDMDAYYFANERQEAGRFLREYAGDTLLGKTFPQEAPRHFEQPKKITAVGVSLEVGQTKALAEMLAAVALEPGFEPDRTVVVLPQEHMLFPVLHAIPDGLDKVNVTMGYPLKDTPVYSLLESALALQQHLRQDVKGGTSFYYKPVVDLLEHPLLFSLESEAIQKMISEVRQRNTIRLAATAIPLGHPVFKAIFTKADSPFIYLLGILEKLYQTWKDQHHDMEMEFAGRFYRYVEQLQEMMGAQAAELDYDFLIRLFRRMSRSLKVPFTGEPLNGLQVMGVLETRNLDFDRVYILNMNEDSWPAAARRGSFIPYNIRRAFGMPTFDHQDAIYAYLFYRLLQRASEVTFFYNTVSEFNVNGELSRLVQQLDVESSFVLERRILASPIEMEASAPIVVEKDAAVWQKLQRFTQGYTGKDGSQFTPSALGHYLDCRLRFYLKYVEKLYETEEVQEEMDAMLFGNLLHDSMELLYRQFTETHRRMAIYPEDFVWIKAGVKGALNKAFKAHYGMKGEERYEPEGKALIAHEIILKLIDRILKLDHAYAPFEILGLEASTRDGFSLVYPVKGKRGEIGIRLKGIIDRLDRKKGKVRVIDYKTGRDERGFDSFDSLTDRSSKKRNKAVFQVFYYAWLVHKTFDGEYQQIEPGLFNSKDIFASDFQWTLQDKQMGQVTDFQQYAPQFETALSDLLAEMFDPEVPFDQTDDWEKCKFCPYVEICGR